MRKPVRRWIALSLMIFLLFSVCPVQAGATGSDSFRKITSQEKLDKAIKTTVKHILKAMRNGEIKVDSFTWTMEVTCSENMYKKLTDKNSALFSALLNQHGVFGYSYSNNSSTRTIKVWITWFYTGGKLKEALSCFSGDEKALKAVCTEREYETYKQAKKIVAKLKTGNSAKTAKNLHDWLRDKVSYGNNGKDEGSHAIGALLNRQADCDGFTDAYILLCAIAGIKCRYVYGGSKGSWSGHAWNLVKLSGKWYMTDVTWDACTKSDTYWKKGVKQIRKDHDFINCFYDIDLVA